MADRAVRVDRETGIREIAEFIDGDGAQIFAYAHVPQLAVTTGVVICSPLYAEFLRNYRREVLMGRRLAARGIAVQRFHYRGHGNSGAWPDHVTLDSMKTDASVAANRLTEATGATRLAFFGTRWGALVAAGTAGEFDGAPIALWDPILDASQYFSDMVRAVRLQSLVEVDPDGGSPVERGDSGEIDGAIDILGYSVTPSLFASSKGRTLEGEAGSLRRPVLIVQLGDDLRVRQRYVSLAGEWSRRRFEVDLRSIGRREPWWFTAGQVVSQEALDAPLALTIDWLIDLLTVPSRTSGG